MQSSVLEYLSGLTTYAFDESVLKRIALDRGVSDDAQVTDLDKKTKDLMWADMLYVVYTGPNVLPSFTHQHGQFSLTVGQQAFGDKDRLLSLMRGIYAKYDDDMIDRLPEEAQLHWEE